MSMNTKAEVRRRVGIVYKLKVAGLSRQEIIQVCSEKYGWHASDRTIDNYSAEASARFIGEIDADGKEEQGKALARYVDQYRKADARGDHRGASAIVDKIVALKGLAASTKVEVSGPNGGPIPLQNLATLSNDELAALEALLEKLDDQGAAES